MRVAVLRTYSLSCEPIFAPLRRLGHEVVEIEYCSVDGATDHKAIPAVLDAIRPDWALVLGQHDDGRGQVPPPHVLAAIASSRPTVHICCDGSERIWWPQLEEYDRRVPFALHVNIDGVRDGFFAKHGLTTLCPIDDALFAARYALSERPTAVGFCGGWGPNHPRGDAMPAFTGLVHAVKRPFADYVDYCRFLMSCRCVWNHAANGTGDRMHVKARVVEAALAGALLLEQEGSPAAEWFVPGEDYLTWRDSRDVEAVLSFVRDTPGWAGNIARSLTAKVIERHAAAPFWRRVFAELGFHDLDHAAVAV